MEIANTKNRLNMMSACNAVLLKEEHVTVDFHIFTCKYPVFRYVTRDAEMVEHLATEIFEDSGLESSPGSNFCNFFGRFQPAVQQ